METKKLKPYIKVVSPDDKYFVWVKRPDSNHRSYMIFNFGEYKAQFADMLDKLAYLNVEEVKQLDEMDKDIFMILFSFEGHDPDDYRNLAEDISNIMYCILKI